MIYWRVEVLESDDHPHFDFVIKNIADCKDNHPLFFKQMLEGALHSKCYKAANHMFDAINVPKDLSLKERISYYQLLES